MQDVIAAGASNLLNIALMLGAIVLCFGIFGGIAYAVRQYQKWNEYKVMIWRHNSNGDLEFYTDSAGIFLMKSINAKRFFLKKSNVGLPPDKVPYINLYGGFFPQKIVQLYQDGLKNFHFIRPHMNRNVPSFSVGEEDVNWAINTYESSKKSFINNTLLQMLPYISLLFVAIIIMIIFIWFFKQFDVLKDLGVALTQASENLAIANANIV
ncbi:MAG: hypothetical protein R3250_12885 [Melioribacteraceae bacterium]|nr:hypothetical protein [Melioribacteraceae bacterium]